MLFQPGALTTMLFLQKTKGYKRKGIGVVRHFAAGHYLLFIHVAEGVAFLGQLENANRYLCSLKNYLYFVGVEP